MSGTTEDRPVANPTLDESSAIPALGEVAAFRPGDRVRIAMRSPVGHYRVPAYLRGKSAYIEAVIEPRGVDNEEEGFGRNAGQRLHYYRVGMPLTAIWPDYGGSAHDALRIEVFENWLERM